MSVHVSSPDSALAASNAPSFTTQPQPNRALRVAHLLPHSLPNLLGQMIKLDDMDWCVLTNISQPFSDRLPGPSPYTAHFAFLPEVPAGSQVVSLPCLASSCILDRLCFSPSRRDLTYICYQDNYPYSLPGCSILQAFIHHFLG